MFGDPHRGPALLPQQGRAEGRLRRRRQPHLLADHRAEGAGGGQSRLSCTFLCLYVNLYLLRHCCFAEMRQLGAAGGLVAEAAEHQVQLRRLRLTLLLTLKTGRTSSIVTPTNAVHIFNCIFITHQCVCIRVLKFSNVFIV